MEAHTVDHSPRQDSRAARQAASGPLGLFDLILSETPEPAAEAAKERREAADRRGPAAEPPRERPEAAADPLPGETQAATDVDPGAQAPQQTAQATAELGGRNGQEAASTQPVATVPPAAAGGQGPQAAGPEGAQAVSPAAGRQVQTAATGSRPASEGPGGPGGQADAKTAAGFGAAGTLSAPADALQKSGPDSGLAPLGQAATAAQASAVPAAGAAGPKIQAAGATPTGGASRSPAAAGNPDAVAAAKSPATAALSKDTLLSLAVDPVAAAPGDPNGVDPAAASGLRALAPGAPGAVGPGDFAGLVRGAAGDARPAGGGANEQVAVQIRRAVASGNDRISIRLHPAELGRVQVRLEVGDDGQVRALITAERAETLDLMQRDQRGLERALQDAGLKTDSSSLSFTLQDQAGGHSAAAEEEPQGRAAAQERQAAEETDPEQGRTLYWSAGDGRLDIRI